jgi:hypothetical protein
MSNEWQPIETAPKDGSVILTSEGTARWLDDEFHAFWVACDSQGCPYSCIEEGYYHLDNPCVWIPLPYPKGE